MLVENCSNQALRPGSLCKPTHRLTNSPAGIFYFVLSCAYQIIIGGASENCISDTFVTLQMPDLIDC